ncbi:hypothetical protein MYX84_06320 [Acidobacteria bacterium AH-259-O06]|nr:hypothetical protein [Acidobacteria bacterium AH-259-O06]
MDSGKGLPPWRCRSESIPRPFKTYYVIANLGRLDLLAADGQLDRLVQSLARFSLNLRVLSAAQAPRVDSCQTRLWGPPLVFARPPSRITPLEQGSV